MCSPVGGSEGNRHPHFLRFLTVKSERIAMAIDKVIIHTDPDWPWTNPWPPLLVGLGGAAAAFLLSSLLGTGLTWLLLGIGLLGGAAAVVIRLQSATSARFEERLDSAAVVGLGAVIALLSSAALGDDWDTARLTLRILTAIAFLGAAVLLLSSVGRRIAVSVLVLFHFGGIFIAVNNLPTREAPASWLVTQIWIHVYRPYLQFFFLNNSYHFYSPEPGPTPFLWFRIAYADGTARWVKVPDDVTPITGLELRRIAALSTSIAPNAPPNPRLQVLLLRRQQAGMEHKPPIPLGDVAPQMQYREPDLAARRIMSSYVRRVAQNSPHPTDPSQPITGIKVYHVEVFAPTPEDFHDGLDPRDPALMQPFYQGEFDADGQIKPSSYRVEYDDKGMVKEIIQDPFLYWLIPIQRESRETEAPVPTNPVVAGEPPRVPLQAPIKNYLEIHAGDKSKGSDR